jgi:replicative DNA helicase
MVKPTEISHDPGAPFSQEAEENTLGSVLLDPSQYPLLAGYLRPDDFFLLRHNYIWKAMGRLYERGDAIDYITVGEELENMQVLQNIGGRAYLLQLVNNTGTAMYAEVYARLVERTAIRRRLMVAADDIKKLAQDESLNIETVEAETEAKILSVFAGITDKGIVPAWDIASDHYDGMERRMQSEGMDGIPSGFRDIDALLRGYPKDELTVIAARPGMGKTAFALCLAANMARLGVRILFFSIEMSISRLFDRLVAIETGIHASKIADGKLTPHEAARYTEAIGRISKWMLFFDDSSALKPEAMRAKAQRVRYEYGLDIVIIDYLQIMSTTKDYGTNETARVSHLSWQCKLLAKDFGLPVIALSQLSRAVEQRKDKRPMLSDLRSSGSIEQDASVVQFLYRDEVYNDATEFPNQAEVITAKNRNGGMGTMSLYFEKTMTKFMDASVHRVDLSDLE